MTDTKTTKKKTTTKVTKKEVSKSTKKAEPKKTVKKAIPKKSVTKKAVTKKSVTKKAVIKSTLKYADAKNSDKFAIIKIGGSQLKVVEGLKYEVKKLAGVKGDTIENTDILLVAKGKDVKVGTPTVKGAKVTLQIDSQKKGDKVRSFKFKAKSRYRKTIGSRELLTRVLVKKIEA